MDLVHIEELYFDLVLGGGGANRDDLIRNDLLIGLDKEGFDLVDFRWYSGLDFNKNIGIDEMINEYKKRVTSGMGGK